MSENMKFGHMKLALRSESFYHKLLLEHNYVWTTTNIIADR